MQPPLNGKMILVTGATNGLGLVTARELARMGAQVCIVSRDAAKCARVTEQLKRETGNAQVEHIAADLSTRIGIQQAAHEFKKRHTRLDVLINNAGALFLNRQLSADGIEMSFSLNHLNYFHLTILLLDLLKTSAPSRVINISSNAHRRGRIDFDDLQRENGYVGLEAYGQSKLANLLFTYELARKLDRTRVTVNAVHPGSVSSGFAKNNGPLVRLGMGLISVFQRGVDQGADTIVYLASSPEVEGLTGKYFTDRKAVASSPASYDQAAAERLWQVSLEMIA